MMSSNTVYRSVYLLVGSVRAVGQEREGFLFQSRGSLIFLFGLGLQSKKACARVKWNLPEEWIRYFVFML